MKEMNINPFDVIDRRLTRIEAWLADIKDDMKPLIAAEIKSRIPKQGDRFISGQQVQEILGISNVTRYEWEKLGILRGYKIGSRRKYKLSEVFSAPVPIKSNEV